ncbi:hypothetical protein AADR41_13055 [Streptomyces sp. CLV115]|uniref:hypothetical protein n=1 Tax=Streptomyces sp. CLV115 TaxID=3138502 RepID=UPI00313E2DEF
MDGFSTKITRVCQLRDLLNIAARAPWGFPQWNANDPEGEDVRAASVYFLNRRQRHLSVLDIVWFG